MRYWIHLLLYGFFVYGFYYLIYSMSRELSHSWYWVGYVVLVLLLFTNIAVINWIGRQKERRDTERMLEQYQKEKEKIRESLRKELNEQ